MIRKLYDWCIDLAAKPYAMWALFIYAFAESSFFPLPVELMLIPMIIATPHRAFFIAFVAVSGSVLGGIAGYGIGAFAFEAIGEPMLKINHALDKFDQIAALYNDWGIWAVLIGGLTPIPYKLITIASGVTGFNLLAFVASSVVARGIRFGVIALLLYYFGSPIRDFIEKRLGLVFMVFIALLLGGFLMLGFL